MTFMVSPSMNIFGRHVEVSVMLLSRKSKLENTGHARDAVIRVDTLLAADSDLAGKSILRDYFNVNRYTPFEGEVVDRFRDVRRFVYGDRP